MKGKSMKTFRVQQSHFIEKKAWVSVEADNGTQAIEKARALQWEDFEQRETVDQTQWKLASDNSMSLLERLVFLFTGESN